MFVERLWPHTTFLLLCLTERRSKSQKEKSASKDAGRPRLCRVERARVNNHAPFPSDPEVSEVPSKRLKVRRPRRREGDAPWSSRVSGRRARPTLEI